jgi:steroid 5-alpha reductase family enzyme
MDKKRLIIYPLLFLITFAIATVGFTDVSLETNLVIPYAVILGSFITLFVIATVIKDNSIVDMFWGMGFVVGAITTLLITPNPTVLSYAVTGFIVLWGLRLSIRLTRRNWGRPEDFRYAQWREEWGKNVVITAFFRVFMVQGIINFTVGSASYMVIRHNTFVFGEWDVSSAFLVLGSLLALTGLFFEVVGDEQLRAHIAKKTKTLLTTGLWSVTRHPNYFGEVLIWNGLYFIGFSAINEFNPLWFYFILILSPLVMSLVLVKISTPLLEANMKKYAGWDEYIKEVPMIFPWGQKG